MNALGLSTIPTATFFPSSGSYPQSGLTGSGWKQTDASVAEPDPTATAKSRQAVGALSSQSAGNPADAGQTDTTTQTGTKKLTKAQKQLVAKLKAEVAAVRAHEMAHLAVGGWYITSGVDYRYEWGPDGKIYAVGGDVSISASPVPNDPQATINKMEVVRNAALAPAHPSSQDLAVAAQAARTENQARMELIVEGEKKMIEASTTGAKSASGGFSKNRTLHLAGAYVSSRGSAADGLLSTVG